MSNDPEDTVLVRGRKVEKSDLRPAVEAEDPGYTEIGKGLAYVGMALVLLGIARALSNLPADLSETSGAVVAPAVGPIQLGVALLAIGGVATVLLSKPVLDGIERLHERVRSAPDPLETDGGQDD